MWEVTKTVGFLKYERKLSLRWNKVFFFRRGWVANFMWISNRILFPEIAFYLNSEYHAKKVTTWKVGRSRKIQQETSIFERKNDWNLNGFLCLKILFFPQTSVFLRRFIWGRFVEATTFCQGNAFFSENHHRQILRTGKLPVEAACFV